MGVVGAEVLRRSGTSSPRQLSKSLICLDVSSKSGAQYALGIPRTVQMRSKVFASGALLPCSRNATAVRFVGGLVASATLSLSQTLLTSEFLDHVTEISE